MTGWARWVLCGVLAACGGGQASLNAQTVVLCPAGSVLDPQAHACVAIQGAKPVVVEPELVAAPVDAGTTVTVAVATVDAEAPAPQLPPPQAGAGFAVDVRCTFSGGWVALLPANKYPKDDQFLMQALIGLTDDPRFWNGLQEYRPLHPYAAKHCTGAPMRLMAPTAGDYYVLAGQTGSFSARGTYDKNGVRRKIAVTANAQITLNAADLTHTWLCISCPWIVMSDGHGGDMEPFVVLRNRRSRAERGTDAHQVMHVPVVRGMVRLRILEVERETTHLDRLVLRVNGRELSPTNTALAADDALGVVLGPQTEVSATFVVPGVTDGFVDALVVATGYYDPQ